MWTLAVGVALAAQNVDHKPLSAILEGAVSGAGVSYVRLRERREALGAYVQSLEAVEVSSLSKSEQLALWINAYNAHTLAVVIDAGPPKSILEIDDGEVWKRRTFTVAGEVLTLDAMEHQRARPLGDGRVHAAVNCASKGCPPLPPAALEAATLDQQLDTAARLWAGSNAYSWVDGQLRMSKIFDWYAEDFEDYRLEGSMDPKLAGAVGFLVRFVDEAEAARLRAAAAGAGWQDYDWSLNQQES